MDAEELTSFTGRKKQLIDEEFAKLLAANPDDASIRLVHRPSPDYDNRMKEGMARNSQPPT